MKRLKLCALLSAMLMIFLITALPAYASYVDRDWIDPDPNEDYRELTLGEARTLKISDAKTVITYKVTVSENGLYDFYTKDTAIKDYADTVGRLLEYDPDTGKCSLITGNDDADEGNHFSFTSELKAGKTYYIQVMIYGSGSENDVFDLYFEKNKIKDIEYVPENVMSAREGTNGYLRQYDDEPEVYVYNYQSYPKDGDKINLYMEGEDEPDVYTFDEDEYDFINSDGDEIDYDDVEFTDNQFDAPWTVGENKYFAEVMGVKCEVPFIVEPYEISKIEYTPASSISLLEEADGEWKDNHSWYKYEYPTIEYEDILTITDSDGVVNRYKCNGGSFNLVDEDGYDTGTEFINGPVLKFTDDQDTNHWTPDGENKITVSFLDKSTTIPVEIRENEVAGISFEPADEHEFEIAECDPNRGSWYYDYNDEVYYFYYDLKFNDGDKLTVTYKDNSSQTYTFYKSENDEYYYSQSYFLNDENPDDVLYLDDIDLTESPNQHDDHWASGEYGANITYNGRTLEDPIVVTIKAGSVSNLLTEINARLEEDSSLEEEWYTDGSWEDYSDARSSLVEEIEDDDHTYSRLSRLFGYYKEYYDELEVSTSKFNRVHPEDAASINVDETKSVIVKPDPLQDKTATFVFECDQTGRYVFTSTDNEESENGYPYYDHVGRVLVYDEGEKEYKVLAESNGTEFRCLFKAEAGKTYYLQTRCSSTDREQYFDVTLGESEIVDITYTPAAAREYTQYEDANYYYSYDLYYYRWRFGQNDKITITYKDDSSITYTYDDNNEYFINDNDTEDMIYETDVVVSDTQRTDPWDVGKHEFTLTIYTFECSVPATVLPYPVTSIRIEPLTPFSYNENDMANGSYTYDDDGERFFYYNIPRFSDGDKLIVTDNNVEYTYEFEQDEDYYWDSSFYNSDRGRIYLEDMNIDEDGQYDDHWLPNKDNSLKVSCLHNTCNVSVTIVEPADPLAAIKADAELLLDSVKNIRSDDYTEASYKALQDAKKALEDALDDPDATVESIRAAMDALEEAKLGTAVVEEDPDNEQIQKRMARKAAFDLLDDLGDEDAEDYTTASFTNYAKKRDALQKLLEDNLPETTADDIRTAMAALESAYNALVPAGSEPDPDAEAKAAAIDAATAELESDAVKNATANKSLYTDESYKAFDDAKAELLELIASDASTASEIDAAVQAMKTALSNLKTKIDAAKEAAETELSKSYVTATIANKDTFTDETYKAFSDAKAALEALIASDTATVEQINQAISDLESAYESLKTKADAEAEAKAQAIADATALLDSVKDITGETYTSTSYAAFTNAKEALENAIAEGSTADSTAIRSAIEALETAKANLKTPEEEETAMAQARADAAALLDSVKDIKQEDYSSATYGPFAAAKKALEDALAEGSGADSNMIRSAITELEKAKANLRTPEQEEAAAKEAAVAEANALLTSDDVKNADAAQADYTEESFKAYKDAKEALDAALSDAGKTSADINKLIDALKEALKGLVKEADAKADALAAAKAAVTAAGKVVTTKYQTATVTPFKDALGRVKAILKNPDAFTSGYINMAVDKLTAAKAALKLKKVNPMTAKAKKITVKASVLKKRSKTIKKAKAFTIRKAKGTVTFKITKKAKKAGKKIVISKKGKVTLKKGLKKGKYVMKVKVTASGNGIYKKKVKYIKKFTVVVK